MWSELSFRNLHTAPGAGPDVGKIDSGVAVGPGLGGGAAAGTPGRVGLFSTPAKIAGGLGATPTGPPASSTTSTTASGAIAAGKGTSMTPATLSADEPDLNDANVPVPAPRAYFRRPTQRSTLDSFSSPLGANAATPGARSGLSGLGDSLAGALPTSPLASQTGSLLASEQLRITSRRSSTALPLHANRFAPKTPAASVLGTPFSGSTSGVASRIPNPLSPLGLDDAQAEETRGPSRRGASDHAFAEHSQPTQRGLSDAMIEPVSTVEAAGVARGQNVLERFVTVFGFPARARGAILKHFQQCGQVVSYMTASGLTDAEVASTHAFQRVVIEFTNVSGAESALSRHGSIIDGTMIGVKPTDPEEVPASVLAKLHQLAHSVDPTFDRTLGVEHGSTAKTLEEYLASTGEGIQTGEGNVVNGTVRRRLSVCQQVISFFTRNSHW